jgi:acylphosphatase
VERDRLKRTLINPDAVIFQKICQTVTAMKVRAHVIVTGRVQGVFFRSQTEHEAKRRGVKGWIRNLPDSRVEAVFEGEKESVERLIEFCKRGPPGARVTKIDVIWKSYVGDLEEFKIRYGYRF